jgi:hypothetical protein
MPVHTIVCPDCGNVAKSLVLKGAQMPSEWSCSKCRGHNARPNPTCIPEVHPWEMEHGAACPCCGAAREPLRATSA